MVLCKGIWGLRPIEIQILVFLNQPTEAPAPVGHAHMKGAIGVRRVFSCEL